MNDFLASLLIVLAAFVIWILVWLARNVQLPRILVASLAALSAAILMGLILTDWPLQDVTDFWERNSILTDTIFTLAIAGVVFFLYSYGEQQRQNKLSWGLSGSGAGGAVDSVIDIEVALSLLTRDQSPGELESSAWADWDSAGKPLRWLREDRSLLLDGSVRDPRRVPVRTAVDRNDWVDGLLNQSIRRLLAAMREWSPLLGASDEGVAMLLVLSDIRVGLMRLQEHYSRDGDLHPSVVSEIAILRAQLRVIASYFETWSSAPSPRFEVLTDAEPLSHVRVDFTTPNRLLTKGLRATSREMGFIL